MTVNVIVTDMDGTFLDDAKKYDRTRFMAQYQELKNVILSLSSPAAISITSSSLSFLNSRMKSVSWPKTARWCLSMASSFFMAN